MTKIALMIICLIYPYQFLYGKDQRATIKKHANSKNCKPLFDKPIVTGKLEKHKGSITAYWCEHAKSHPKPNFTKYSLNIFGDTTCPDQLLGRNLFKSLVIKSGSAINWNNKPITLNHFRYYSDPKKAGPIDKVTSNNVLVSDENGEMSTVYYCYLGKWLMMAVH